MNDTDLMKFHIAAVKMILSLDEPKMPKEKINRLIEYSHELNLQWSDYLLKFYVQAILRTCQIIKILCKKKYGGKIKMDLPVFIDLPKSAVFQLKIIDCLRKNHHQKNFITDADLTAQAIQDATKFAATEGLNYSTDKISQSVQAIQAILFLDDLWFSMQE